MKKLLFLAIATIFSFSLTSTAQMTKGKIVYSIEASADTPEMEMAVSMMDGTTMEMIFDKNKTRVEASMGTMMTMTTVSDGDSDAMLMLMDMQMMGTKMAIVATISEVEASAETLGTKETGVTLINESKEIAGYKCKKALVKFSDENEYTFWYTEEIKVNTKGQSNMGVDIPGLPMEFEVAQQGLSMKYSVKSVSKDLGDDPSTLFSLDVPEGYTEMTYDQLMNMGNM